MIAPRHADGPPAIRRATLADVEPLAAMLERAFRDDPVAAWAFRHAGARRRALERFQAIRLRQTITDEDVWTAADHSCAALWSPPERWHNSLREDAALAPCFAHPRLLGRLPLVSAGWLAMERKHPASPPHYYLAVLGTDPEHQGRGLGSALLRPVLERCDDDGLGVYLECSKERNIDFYARHGFRVREELRLLRGPSIWTMWRDPRG
jgi:ribosomal protein S18 acetylase RimI-like enzyme